MIIALPYPPSGLNPNARLHWAKKLKITRAYQWACSIQLHEFRNVLPGKTQFRITAAPPDSRRRDSDNFIASMKAGIDQLSKHVGIDDSRFRIDWPREFLPPVKGGAVYLEIIG